jgi:hypothetical protein
MFFMFGVWAFGEPAATPSSAGVLPAPASLSVVANVDQGCSGRQGPQMVCAREIELALPSQPVAAVSGSGPAARTVAGQEAALGAQAARTIVSSMGNSGYGWQVAPGQSGTWHACRSVGWFLDTHSVCASVQAHQRLAIVTIEVVNDW